MSESEIDWEGDSQQEDGATVASDTDGGCVFQRWPGLSRLSSFLGAWGWRDARPAVPEGGHHPQVDTLRLRHHTEPEVLHSIHPAF